MFVITFVAGIFVLSATLSAQTVNSAQTANQINLEKIGIDSLRSEVLRISGLQMFYRTESGEDSLSVTLNCKRENFLGELSLFLSKQGYSMTRIGNSLFVLKGTGILAQLPQNYFEAGEKDEKSEEHIKSLTSEDVTAKSENKVYKIGDPNRPSTESRPLLNGYVRNSETGEPIGGVSVIVGKPNTVVTTDQFGFYRILIPKGSMELVLKGYGLQDSKLMLEVYGDGELDVLMKDKVYPLKGIVLTAESAQKMRSTQIGLERVRIDRIKHVPAVFGEADVMKIVLTLPGVKSVGESSGGFNVRGGASDQNLILFNEGTIYNPTHLFGLFSSFNPDIVNDVELYKSTIPAKYGGRISSVLEINSRNGNSKKITGSAGLGLLTGKFHIEGPVIEDKTNFIACFRTTYSNWILGLIPPESGYNEGTASFRDATLGINHKIDKRNNLYLYAYYSGDGFRFNPDTSCLYSNMNYSVKWRNIISEKHNLVVSAGYDQYNYKTEEKGNEVNARSLKFDIRQIFLKANFNYLASDKHSVNYGLNTIYYNLNPGELSPVGEESLIEFKRLSDENALETALYVSDTWNILDKLSLDLGLRYTFFSTVASKTDDQSAVNSKPNHGPEFRLSARYSFSDDLSVKGGINTMRQNIHMLSNTSAVSPTDIWKLSDSGIAPQKGWQAAVGLYRNALGRRVELSAECYYKEMYDYLDYKSGAVLVMNENIGMDVLTTQGRAYGIELLAKKPMGKLNGWFAYTYSRTELKESGDNKTINQGNWYPASYDKPHDFKLVGNYKFTQRFSISLNVDYASGRPITIPISKYYYGDGYRLYYSDRNAYRIPDYFRMDFAVNIEPSHNLRLWTHSTITFGVYNITGRRNTFSIYYNTTEGTRIQGYKLSIFGSQIPYINYNIKF